MEKHFEQLENMAQMFVSLAARGGDALFFKFSISQLILTPAPLLLSQSSIYITIREKVCEHAFLCVLEMTSTGENCYVQWELRTGFYLSAHQAAFDKCM